MQYPESDQPAPSKSRRKRDMIELQKLGEELVTFADAALREMGLPQALLEAIEATRRIKTRGGHRRQLQYIGRLMRELDAAPIRAAVAARNRQEATHTHAFQRLEGLRDALINEGDAALAGVLEEFPAAEREELRRLARAARTEHETGQPPRASRALFRYLRELQSGSSRTPDGE